MNPPAKRAIQIHERLLAFYGEPIWRNPMPPIDELVSTILSQNTNDVNRDRAYNSLRAKFQTWEEVRDAQEADVVNAIRPAGLANQKGPRIQQVLRSITEERGNLDLSFLGDLPVQEAKAWLTRFNGVGPKTAAIVLCFSLGKPAFPSSTARCPAMPGRRRRSRRASARSCSRMSLPSPGIRSRSGGRRGSPGSAS